MNKQRELSAILQWEVEEYKYLHHFSVERIGMYFSKIFYRNEELNTPKTLFKFYDSSNWSLDALLHNYLYFGNPRDFNDPFDCLSNREDNIKKNGEGISKHRDEIGICCFSTVCNNPLMWGHYTRSFTGFAVKFNNDNLLNNEHIAIRSHVSYLRDYQPSNPRFTSVRNEFREMNIDSEIKDNALRLLVMLHEYCWKYIDWKYEKEFRAIALESSEFDRKLPFDKSDVMEIYIGHRMKSHSPIAYNFLQHIIRTEYPNVKVFIVKPHPFIVQLDFNLIK